MISRLTLSGLASHTNTTLDFDRDGVTHLEGGSGAGKSTLLDALCYLLWGTSRQGTALPVEQLSAEKANLSLTVGKTGSVLARTITGRRSETRTLTRSDGAAETFQSNEDAMAKLGPIGANPTIGRLIVVPMAWRDLLTRDLGRPLRDALLTVLPRGDLRAVVGQGMRDAGLGLDHGDMLDLKSALIQQTSGNRARDEAAGKLSAEREALARAQTTLIPSPTVTAHVNARASLALADRWARCNGASTERATLQAKIDEANRVLAELAPTPLDTTEARQVIERAKAWAAHAAAAERHQERVRARDQVRARRAELGERPSYDAAALSAKQEQLSRLGGVLTGMRASTAKAREQATEAHRQLDALAARVTTCPTCGQAWAKRAEARALAERLVASSDAKAAEEAERLARNETSLAEIEREIAALLAQVAAGKAWDQRSRDIGAEPDVGQPPRAPTGIEPTATEVSAAEGTISRAAGIEAERIAHERARLRTEAVRANATRALADLARDDSTPSDPAPSADQIQTANSILRQREDSERTTIALRVAEAALRRAEEEHQRATAEAARRAVLVRVVRAAPTQIARSQIAALGDLGPVSIEFPDKANAQSPEIEVRIFGRPYWLASDGEQLLADVHLRAGLRGVAKLGGLPLVIDRPQDWSGDWPEIAGPVWFLRTTDGALRVSGGGS